MLPIGLAIVGLGGAWLALPGTVVAYRSAVPVGVGLVLLRAWIRLFKRNGCAEKKGGAVALAIFASLSFVVAASAPLWEADATRLLMEMWSATR